MCKPMCLKTINILFAFNLICPIYSLKILLYNTGSARSHVVFGGTLVDALVDRGHFVDQLIMTWNPSVTTNGTKNARNVYRINLIDEKSTWQKMDHLKDPMKFQTVSMSNPIFEETRQKFCHALLQNQDLIKTLKNEKYDIGLTSLYDNCGVGLFHLLEINAVCGFFATPMMDWTAWELGLPMSPSYMSETLNWKSNHGFIDRLTNFYNHFNLMFNIKYFYQSEQEEFKKIDPNFPNLAHLIKQISYIYIISHEILDMKRPISGKIKHIGGIGMTEQQKLLDEHFTNILSNATNGVVLFSLGSNVKTLALSIEIKKNFLNAFAKFSNIKFIWKYDEVEQDKELFENYSNVIPVEWVPQVELLNDKRVRAFITHMGINSYVESAYAGVPIIGIPLFADQFYNAATMSRLGLGVVLNKLDLTVDTIAEALEKVIRKNSYRKNAEEISRILKNQPLKSNLQEKPLKERD